MRTGASGRNWNSYGGDVDLAPTLNGWERDLLTDPQTSGGLLIAVAVQQAADILALAHADGFDAAAVVGRVEAGPARVRVE